jgi:hypothetical protein
MVYADKAANGIVQKKGYLHLWESPYRHQNKTQNPSSRMHPKFHPVKPEFFFEILDINPNSFLCKKRNSDAV